MHVLPIAEATLDIIEVLNNGVRPELEEEETFFVYKGNDEAPEILNEAGMKEKFDDIYGTIVKIWYRQ